MIQDALVLCLPVTDCMEYGVETGCGGVLGYDNADETRMVRKHVAGLVSSRHYCRLHFR